MINYQSFMLENGLQVLVHQDCNTPLVALNVLYNVGSRDENENKTGLAHLSEHIMFGGSRNIPSFYEPLHKAGGISNAFTSSDITNYHILVPAANLEVAFWLESDRMLGLSFDPAVLETQRKVVIEEFKERFLNQSYGDMLLKLRPLAYKVHPYRWYTIGKDISHIEGVIMDDVRDFFDTFYRPNNAVLVIAGNTTTEQAKRLASKWFGPIPSGPVYVRNLPPEPRQQEARHLSVKANVSMDALFRAYHVPGRYDEGYHTAHLLGSVLGLNQSSRLHRELIAEGNLFNSINAYTTSNEEPGLLVIEGYLNPHTQLHEAARAVDTVVARLVTDFIPEAELERAKNKFEYSNTMSEMQLLERAEKLAHAAAVGNPDLVNQESESIQAVTTTKLTQMACTLLTEANSSTLFYQAMGR